MEQREIAVNDDMIIKIHVRKAEPSDVVEGIATDSTGLDMWPASTSLACLCVQRPALIRRAKQVIELGCGIGLPGIVIAKMRKGKGLTPVMFTDGERGAVDLATKNAALNGLVEQDDFAVAELDWMEFLQRDGSAPSNLVPPQWSGPPKGTKVQMWRGVKVVLASDALYTTMLTKPFLETLNVLKQHAGDYDVVVLLANQVIRTVSWGPNKEVVVDEGDAVWETFLDLAQESGWHVRDFDSNGEVRLVAMCQGNCPSELLDELVCGEGGPFPSDPQDAGVRPTKKRRADD